ncbi:hypothetical protein DFH28DRAFT_1129764 [Melampsora americana]|nr:hypothetical protein DFH28DRAFT_1129764 [Melampsora americana]
MRIVTLAQASSDDHFVQCTSGPNIGQWTCLSNGASIAVFPAEEHVPPAITNSPDPNHMDFFPDGMAESSDELESLYDPFDPNGFDSPQP